MVTFILLSGLKLKFSIVKLACGKTVRENLEASIFVPVF